MAVPDAVLLFAVVALSQAQCLSAGGGRARGRSTGRIRWKDKEQRGSQVPRATASRFAADNPAHRRIVAQAAQGCAAGRARWPVRRVVRGGANPPMSEISIRP